MLQDILLALTGTRGDDAALADAIALADDNGAHLAVLQVVQLPVPMIGPMGIAPDYAIADALVRLREQAAEDTSALRARLERAGISWELRTLESIAGATPQGLGLQARYSDLCMVAGPGPDDDGVPSLFFNALLFDSGRPVLVAPPAREAAWPPAHAVVAWQPTREATRALHDALPLLARCRSVDVLTVDPKVGASRHGEQPGADVATHLARHGLRVEVLALPDGGAAAADVILRHCSDSGAQLLVAGGFGHARAREWMLGGTTRSLLHARIPVLFSH